jgi:hypothetical protein
MRDAVFMRTTLDIDDDVLQAAKELAAGRGVTAGKVISGLARVGLVRPASLAERNGVPLLPQRRPEDPKPTMRFVNQLRDEM